MNAKRVSEAVEVLNWMAARIQEMPDRERATIEAGIFLALSSVCLSDYAHSVKTGAEPYDALKDSAESLTDYRKELLKNWAPFEVA